MGASGLPVFASGATGVTALFGPTGGYLLAFPLVAFFVGWMIQQRTETAWTLFTFILGTVGLFLLGTLYLNSVYFHNISRAVQSGFLIFTVWDGFKILAATGIYRAFRRKKDSAR